MQQPEPECACTRAGTVDRTDGQCDGAAHSSRCDAWKYPAFPIFLTDGKQNKALTFGNG